MKVSKHFKVGVFYWIVFMIYIISDNLWIKLINFEVFLALTIYLGTLTKKSKAYQLFRGITIVIMGLLYMMMTFQKMHNNSIENFNKNYNSSPSLQNYDRNSSKESI